MRFVLILTAMAFGFSQGAWAFCGFYVASDGPTPFNDASKVVLARQGQRTTITMSSDVSGAPKDFALVVPVPTVVQKDQVRVIQSATIDHLDQYSVPRLVEYHDPDPCAPPIPPMIMMRGAVPAPMAAAGPPSAAALGVKVEAEYSVGEYDIQVLSARDSSGLLTYLNTRHYRIPAGAEPVIGSYLRQHMNFFVAKVNLGRIASGSTFLRPIQVDYESPKFMLPIRLGTVNARGPQDMIVLALTQRGRVETTNYPTRRMPTGTDIPGYVKNDFNGFYRAVFDRQVQDADGQATFLEYAWNLGSCDPCSAPPLSNDELRELGAGWVEPAARGRFVPQDAFLTRLHVRYDRAHFPEDLALQETGDRDSYQARYVIRNRFTGPAACEKGRQYRAGLPERARREARNAVELTNWAYPDVKRKMEQAGETLP